MIRTAMMLRAGQVRVDDLIGPYRWPIHDRAARAVADRIELGGWTDALAWADLTGDAGLVAFRAVYGNRSRRSVADWGWADRQGRLL